MKATLFAFLTFLATTALAQNDSLIFKNGNVMVGEIKLLDKGVITIETAYSDQDFKVELTGVSRIVSQSTYLITLSDGTRFNGKVNATKKDSVMIRTVDSLDFRHALGDLVYLKPVKASLINRIDFNIDLGLTINKANNLRQYSLRTALGYQAYKSYTKLYYNDNYSR